MKNKSNKKVFIGIGMALVLVAIIVVLVVACSKEKFTVTLTVDNEIYQEINKVKDGDTVDLPSNPTKEGYTFDGWYLNGEKFDSKTPVEGDVVLEAKFTINTYSVTFNLDNDSENLKEEVKYNELVEKPKNPKKSGYTFVGWYVGETEFDFNTKITRDMVITAKWTKVTTASYNVEYYLMNLDGTYTVASKTETIKGKINSTVSPEPKNFVGFTAPEKQSATVKADGSTVIKYYYPRNKYNLTISGDNGITNTTGNGTYYYGEKIALSYTLKAGYSFSEYNVSVEDNVYTMPANDIEVKVKSQANTDTLYTVKHYIMDLDGEHYTLKETEILKGTTDTTIKPETKDYEGFSAPELKEMTVTGDGKAEIEYYYTRNKYQVTVEGDEGISDVFGEGIYYYGAKVSVGASLNNGYKLNNWSNLNTDLEFEYVVEAKDITLKATTELINYTINYKSEFNNGLEEEVQNSNPTSYTIKDQITLVEPEVLGYTFVKYLVNGEEIADNIIEAGNCGDLEITFVFEVNQYEVSFETTLGAFNNTDERSILVYYKELIPNVLEDNENKEFYTPTRLGYELNGWSLNKEDEEQVVFDFNTPMVAQNITLYPIWKAIDYEITYDLQDGETCKDCETLKTYTIESEFALPVPVKDGYLFGGWIVNGDDENIITDITKGRTENITLTAKWYEIVEENELSNEMTSSIDEIATKVDENEVVWGFYNYENTFENDSSVLDGLKANIESILSDSKVLEINFTYDKKIFSFKNTELNNIETTLKSLIAALSDSEDFESIKGQKYEILDTKKVNVQVKLNQEYARTADNKDEINYELRFQKLVKIDNNEYKTLVDRNTKYINDHKTTHYELVVENDNMIFKYNKPTSTVFGTMQGAGLKTAMQDYLGDEKIGYVIITLEGMQPVKVTYDDVKGNNFWNFGYSLLDDFEAVVGKGAFRMKNEDLGVLKATLEIVPADGLYFDSSVITKWHISFEPRVTE